MQRETQRPTVLGTGLYSGTNPSPPQVRGVQELPQAPHVGLYLCSELGGQLADPDLPQAWPMPPPIKSPPLSWSSGAYSPCWVGSGSWPQGKVELSASCPSTGPVAPALRSSRASFSASFRKGGRRAGSASQQLLIRVWTGLGQPAGGSMRYPFSTASVTSFSDYGQRAHRCGLGLGSQPQTHMEPSASPPPDHAHHLGVWSPAI